MPRTTLLRVVLSAPAQAEGVALALFHRMFGASVSSFTDFESGRTTVSAWLASADQWSLAKAAFPEVLKNLRVKCAALRKARLTFSRVRPEDWAESWKRHFKPFTVGRELLIKPGWSRRPARKGQATMVLDPGLSFGTGHHPTTAFCLEQIVAQSPRAGCQARRFLDIGTGSGILAIAAAKLGYHPVMAIDSDAEAVRIARANARRNRVCDCIQFAKLDVAALPLRAASRYDLVCANLTSTLLSIHARRIINCLEARGRLVLAGMLGKECAAVCRRYTAAGLRVSTSRAQEEWRSAALEKKF